MAFKGFTRYYRDPNFRAAVDKQFAAANVAAQMGGWITYAIHDPTRVDTLGGRSDGLIIYVGQSKEFHKRVRKRMSSAGVATRRPSDRIDGACYDIMTRGIVPRFTVLDRVESAIDSLISETNWTKRLHNAGYPLLNQWTEQKFAGTEIQRAEVPHAWLWPITAADAIGSNIGLIIRELATGEEVEIDVDAFPPNMRLREIRDHLKAEGRQVRLHVR